MVARKLYFENVRVGDEIPAVAKAPIDRVQLARYAGATGDFNPINVDEAFARSLGMPSVIAPSSLGMNFLGQLVTDWARGAQVKRMSTKFIRTLWPGDTLVCKGRVTDRWGQDGRYHVELDVWAENQKGELAIRGAVTLQVFYSVEDEHRFRVGQPPLVVNVARQSIHVTPPGSILGLAPKVSPAVPAAKAKATPAPAPKSASRASKPAKAAKAKKPAAKARPKPKKPAAKKAKTAKKKR
jgi:acyl dehydratase